MPICNENTPIKEISYGQAPVKAVYNGTDKIWPPPLWIRKELSNNEIYVITTDEATLSYGIFNFHYSVQGSPGQAIIETRLFFDMSDSLEDEDWQNGINDMIISQNWTIGLTGGVQLSDRIINFDRQFVFTHNGMTYLLGVRITQNGRSAMIYFPVTFVA